MFRKTFFYSCILLCFAVSTVAAVTVTNSYTNGTNASVDPRSTSPVDRSIVVSPGDFLASSKITDINILISFDKRDNNGGNCNNYNGGSVFNNEIFFQLTKGSGENVTLVPFNTYGGNTHPAATNNGYISVTLDDEAGAVVGGGTPVAGTFRPVNALSVFDQLDPTDTWTLRAADSAGQDPLCFDSFTITIESSNEADISVTKTDGVGTYTPGGSSIYTIVVANGGPINVEGVLVNDGLPTGASSMSWTCNALGAAVCGAAAGAGPLSNESIDIPVNDTVEFTVTVNWSAVP